MSFGLIAVSALVVLFAGGNILLRARTRIMARRRAGEGFGDFAASFAGEGVPQEVLASAYNFFGEWNGSAGELFPVRAADNISDVYGCVDEDLEDALGEILRESGRRPFTQGERPQPARLETVGDVVRYVASAPAGSEV